MRNFKATITPLLKSDNEEETKGEAENFPYRQALSSLLYLSSKTRPNLSFAMEYASRHVENPFKDKITNLKRILRHQNGTPDLGTEYRNDSNEEIIEVYADSNFVSDSDTGRSTTDYVIFYIKEPVN